MKVRNVIWIATMWLLAGSAAAQNGGKISGYMFGDYYYVAANHNKSIEDANGFWLRRIYFTYDRNLSKAFAVRLRWEMSSPGDFTTSSKLSPAVKDAYLKWKSGAHSVYVGISSTPTWDFIEHFWGYRSVEKTPLDLQKFGSSRDFGVAVKGALDEAKHLNYHIMFGNGSSNKSETNKGKKVMVSLSAHSANGIVAQGYFDYEARPDHTDRYTFQGFLGYNNSKSFRIGLQFASQTRQVVNGDDMSLQIGSVFAAAKLGEKVWGFARADRQFDANPAGAKISYIPFAPTVKSTFFVGGLDFQPQKNVHLMPNVEAVFYENVAGGPDNDLIPR
ncbi:MAG: hypothetical protein D6743_20110, partial [Calditrichaeota bacterium]